jgi:ABC-type multidrug transport system fused ATPase/permease subunit
MSLDPKRKDKRNSSFWRALGFLGPYRGLVVISIVCAFFVSAALAGGLTTLLPIMRVFLNGDTIQTWMNREIAQRRIGVKFADQIESLQIVKIQSDKTGEPAREAGLKIGDVIFSPGAEIGAEGFAKTLEDLSDPQERSVLLRVEGKGNVVVPLAPVPTFLAVGRGVASHFPAAPVPAIASVLGVLLALALFSNVLSYFQEYLSDKAALLAVNDIRRRLYNHVLHVPMSHFGQQGTSDVTSRLTQDAANLAEGFKTVLGQSIQEPIKAVAALTIALLFSWKLTMFILIFAPLLLLIIKKLGKKMRRASKKAMLKSSSMLGQIEGSLAGIRVVKGAVAERFERRRYSRIMTGLVGEQLRMSRIDAFTEPTMATLNLVVVGALVLVASVMVFDWHTLGRDDFIIVMGCLGSIGDSLRRVSKVNNVLQKSNAAAARIFEVMDLPVEGIREGMTKGQKDKGTKGQRANAGMSGPASAPSVPASLSPSVLLPLRPYVSSCTLKLPPLQKDIRFENVTFSYPNTNFPAVLNVDLEVPKGKSIAVVGHNGSGKTTLLALLPRFFEPQQGRILIDGVDIKTATLRSLRSQISIVTQESVIFPGTIADNIAYGQPMLTARRESAAWQALRQRVIEAAQRAFAHEFILEKPQGYDTLLGEMGGQLSGGQKQRICIARAILRQSPILVLDEATSQVDAHNEDLIQRAIESVMKERTTFVIAHRFSTIRSADEIVVMDRGSIVGQGTHEILLATCETYQQLYERQIFKRDDNISD